MAISMSSSVESWKSKDDILSQCSTAVGMDSEMLPGVMSFRESSLSRPSSGARHSRPSSASRLSRPSSVSSSRSVCSLPSIGRTVEEQSHSMSVAFGAQVKDALQARRAKRSLSATRLTNATVRSSSSPALQKIDDGTFGQADRCTTHARESERMVARRPRKDLLKTRSLESHQEVQAVDSRRRWPDERKEVVVMSRRRSSSSPALQKMDGTFDQADRCMTRARESDRMVARRPRKDLPKMRSLEPHEEVQAVDSRGQRPDEREEVVVRKRSVSVSRRTGELKPVARPKLKRRHAVGYHEERQNEAFSALVQNLADANGCESAVQVMSPLVKDVILHSGLPAFPEEQIVAAADEVLQCDAAKWLFHPLLDNPIVKSVFMILEVMCPRRNLNVSDVIGQILWRHRKNEALTSSKCFSRAAADLSWAAEEGFRGAEKSSCTIEGIKEMFKSLTSSRDGAMGNREWCKVVTIIRNDPDCNLHDQALADTDVLFYLQTHSKGEASYDIPYSKFKLLLLTWAEEMQLHPYHILNAISKHAERPDALTDEE